jgi:hypothetical protein
MIISESDLQIEPTAVRFDADRFWVELADGRCIAVPLDWYPRLLRATPEQRKAVEFSRIGLHWEEIDEDISVPGLLAGRWDNTMVGREHRAAKSASKGASAVAAE